DTSGKPIMLDQPLTNFIWYPVASTNEMFAMSPAETEIEMASKSPVLGQLSPTATISSQKTRTKRTCQ
ncbi:Hypothetical predicted protein, partial [Marmota monax]